MNGCSVTQMNANIYSPHCVHYSSSKSRMITSCLNLAIVPGMVEHQNNMEGSEFVIKLVDEFFRANDSLTQVIVQSWVKLHFSLSRRHSTRALRITFQPR